jgi:hypothetical protein
MSGMVTAGGSRVKYFTRQRMATDYTDFTDKNYLLSVLSV